MIAEDELGDALFALLALAERLDVDASAALDESITKYERRMDHGSDTSSGE